MEAVVEEVCRHRCCAAPGGLLAMDQVGVANLDLDDFHYLDLGLNMSCSFRTNAVYRGMMRSRYN